MVHKAGLLVFSGALALLWAGCFCPEVPLEEEEDGPSPELPTSGDPEELKDNGNATIYSFGASKRMLPDIFKGHAETFYCGCPFNGKKVQFKGCGYKVRKNKTRASRLEWEHVVPAAAFGRSFTPWSEGDPKCKNSKREPYKGRRCATKISKKFRRMEADLYNLRPAIGEVNGDRSDKEVGIIDGESREYGSCDVEITRDKVEPREAIRGDVARTYLYMDWAYPGTLNLTAEQKTLFEGWSKADPPNTWEKEWAKRVRNAQGNANPFIQ